MNVRCTADSAGEQQALHIDIRRTSRLGRGEEVLVRKGRLPVKFWEAPLRVMVALKLRHPRGLTTWVVENDEIADVVTW